MLSVVVVFYSAGPTLLNATEAFIDIEGRR